MTAQPGPSRQGDITLRRRRRAATRSRSPRARTRARARSTSPARSPRRRGRAGADARQPSRATPARCGRHRARTTSRASSCASRRDDGGPPDRRRRRSLGRWSADRSRCPTASTPSTAEQGDAAGNVTRTAAAGVDGRHRRAARADARTPDRRRRVRTPTATFALRPRAAHEPPRPTRHECRPRNAFAASAAGRAACAAAPWSVAGLAAGTTGPARSSQAARAPLDAAARPPATSRRSPAARTRSPCARRAHARTPTRPTPAHAPPRRPRPFGGHAARPARRHARRAP